MSDQHPSAPAGRSMAWVGAIPFILSHVAALGVFFVHGSLAVWLTFAALYFVRMFAVTAGYHRYFSHRAFRTSRVFQFILAFVAQTSAQKGVLWWAAHHRRHHKLSDQEGDVHSPVRDGFFYSHVGWLFDDRSAETDQERIADFGKYPELQWLNRYYLVPPILLAVVCGLTMGLPGLLISFFLSTVFVWHGTFFINSLAHVFGSRRFETSDQSRNNPWLALITLGEGWHNNHHRYQSSARNGFYWWEFDITYSILRALALVGVVWDLRGVPEKILEEGRRSADSLSLPQLSADSLSLPKLSVTSRESVGPSAT